MPSVATSKTGIVAAMEREVTSLVRSWRSRTIEYSGRRYRLFESDKAALICGGIGPEAARRATEALIVEFAPARVLSVGFAGALDPSLRVGDVIAPQVVINVADGVRTEAGRGQGVLVSSATVAGKEQKTGFARAYGAIAIDMEAAAVAQGARARRVEFGALKVISDAADFNMPEIDRFIASDGRFQSARFAGYAALRPWLWKTTIMLARNSEKASRALCRALADFLDGTGEVPRMLTQDTSESSIIESLPPEFDSNERTPKFASAHTSVGHGPDTQRNL